MKEDAENIVQKPERSIQKTEKTQGGETRKMARCTSKEQALEALTQVYQEYGKVTQRTIVMYASEHKGSGTPAAATVKKYLGASSDVWTREVAEYLKRKEMSAGTEVPREPEVEKPQRVEETQQVKAEESRSVEESQRVEAEKAPVEAEKAPVEAEEPRQVRKLRLNLTGLTLRIALEGQEYELEIGFGKD